MSSVQSYLRQRNQTSTFLQAPTNTCYYVFVAGPGNYVGNYPPGYMLLLTDNPENIQTQGCLIRDMGKTIKAPIGTNVNATSGFFRAIQLISPTPIASPTSSSTFGVGEGGNGRLPATIPAGNVGDRGYGTYYIPIIIDGIIASEDGTAATKATLPSPYLPIGGQM